MPDGEPLGDLCCVVRQGSARGGLGATGGGAARLAHRQRAVGGIVLKVVIVGGAVDQAAALAQLLPHTTPALPLSDVVDPTGAGDAFAGGFMGYLAACGVAVPDGPMVRRAMICGSTMASFCCEDFSLDRYRLLARADIEARYRAFRHLTHFDELSL